MFIPLSDDDRLLVKPAFVTWTLLGLNVLVFLLQASNPEFTLGYAAIPAEITTGQDLVSPVAVSLGSAHGGSPQWVEVPQAAGPSPIQLTLLTAMFMHAGLMHLGGNMLFLWIFGDNVEHRFGHIPFLIFYLASGLTASFAQIALSPDSVIPTLGASGAIAGVLGAYLVLFPRNRVYTFFIYTVISVPAFLVLVMWVGAQLIGGYGSIFGSKALGETGGVAYMAHLGGFVAGVVVALLYRLWLSAEPDTVLGRQYRRDPRTRRLW
jgi:membrane associated rhomboid family serine protease